MCHAVCCAVYETYTFVYARVERVYTCMYIYIYTSSTVYIVQSCAGPPAGAVCKGAFAGAGRVLRAVLCNRATHNFCFGGFKRHCSGLLTDVQVRINFLRTHFQRPSIHFWHLLSPEGETCFQSRRPEIYNHSFVPKARADGEFKAPVHIFGP